MTLQSGWYTDDTKKTYLHFDDVAEREEQDETTIYGGI